ncbi:hypothetical protein [Thomasclavelia saccharogumia]|uniref:hypothetical protein n=1 Tax=Thomasclavelia saccharogumia TaxID=341225 RepID=UPI000478DBAA|nr:hypothetical protein [Thomasclavelia saccharogumia]
MNDAKKINYHIGARELELENVKLMLPNIGNIKDFISDFRKNARNSDTKLKRLSYEKYDNFISILGGRGLGKTSIMMTIIKQIESHQYFSENHKKMSFNDYDLISSLIVPDDMSETSDILGWIIVVLEKIYNDQIKSYTRAACLLNREDDTREIEKKVENQFNVLKKNYQHRKIDYKNIINRQYQNTIDYVNRSTEIQSQDFDVVETFRTLIDYLIEYKKIINKRHGYEEEPLIFFFFDDVDMTAKYCGTIFEDFLTFLSHSHIVTFISGDYDLFCQSITLKMLQGENLDNREIKEIYSFGKNEKQYQALEMAKSRSEFFLKKVLPPLYRFEIKTLDNRKKSKLTYVNNGDASDLLNKTMEELLANICLDNGNEDFFFKKGHTVIYSYYSTFSSNVRGFMNVYIYLCRQNYQKLQTNKDKIIFIEEFLGIILNSKNTYRKNLNNIDRYLYIKNEKRYEDGEDKCYDKLRIDCEELKEIVEEKIKENYEAIKSENNENKKYLRDDYKEEIEALIILPLFMNELLNCFFKNDYNERYKRVRDKLKNIFVHVFVRAFNQNITLFLPDNADIKDTLLFYSYITTRMSMKAINAINGDRVINYDINVRLYNENNDKKYFVQIMKAACDIFNEENDSDPNKEVYDVLCYGIKKDGKKRSDYERSIISLLIKKYINSNYNWLNNLEKMIKNNLSLMNGLYPYKKYYVNQIIPVFDDIKNLFVSEELNRKLFDISQLLERFTFIFNDENMIRFFGRDDMNVIGTFINIINTFIPELKNIEYSEVSNSNTYLKMIDDYYTRPKYSNNNDTPRIDHLEDLYFKQQINAYATKVEKYKDNYEGHERQFIERMYLLTKQVFDYYYLEAENYHRYDIVDVENIHSNIMNNADIYLKIEDDESSELSQEVFNIIVQIYYDVVDNNDWMNNFRPKLMNLISKLSDETVVRNKCCDYIMEELRALYNLVNDQNSFDRDKMLAKAQALLYITPIYVMSLYLYDLVCSDNEERRFFLNLLSVFNKEL